MSRDIPIIFSATMIHALLDGRKTMTRRLAWRQINLGPMVIEPGDDVVSFEKILPAGGKVIHTGPGEWDFTPFAASPWQRVKPGDRLWTRESLKNSQAGWTYSADGSLIEMAPSDPRVSEMIGWAHHKESNSATARYMPRWASRLTLIVTATKIERVQDISVADSMAEGVELRADRDYQIGPDIRATDPIGCFSALWWALHGIGAWNANPECVCITFRVVKKNIDAMKEAA